MNPHRRFVNDTVTITILFAFLAVLALQPRLRPPSKRNRLPAPGFRLLSMATRDR